MPDIIPTTTTPQDTDSLWTLFMRAVSCLSTMLSRTPARVEGTALVSAARTTTTQSADILTNGADSLTVFLFISSYGGGVGLTCRVRGKDPASGNYVILATSSGPFTAAGGITFAVGDGCGGGNATGTFGNQATNLPAIIRIEISHGDANSHTYSVGYALK